MCLTYGFSDLCVFIKGVFILRLEDGDLIHLDTDETGEQKGRVFLSDAFIQSNIMYRFCTTTVGNTNPRSVTVSQTKLTDLEPSFQNIFYMVGLEIVKTSYRDVSEIPRLD